MKTVGFKIINHGTEVIERQGQEMEIIKGLDDIRVAQTVKFPTHNDVRMRFPNYTAGWVTAYYNHKAGQWVYSYTETKEEAFDHYTELAEMARLFPEFLNMAELSEMYVYHSMGYTNAKWALNCMITH